MGEEAYAKQFSGYLKLGLDSEAPEEMYEKVHAAIRAKPSHTKKVNAKSSEQKRWNHQAAFGLPKGPNQAKEGVLPTRHGRGRRRVNSMTCFSTKLSVKMQFLTSSLTPCLLFDFVRK